MSAETKKTSGEKAAKPEIKITTGDGTGNTPAVENKPDGESDTAKGPQTMTTASLKTVAESAPAKSVPVAPAEPEKPSTKEVTVRINYPKSYEGKRFFEENEEQTVSLPTAEILVKQGIATIISE